jgi:hypothetical protein
MMISFGTTALALAAARFPDREAERTNASGVGEPLRESAEVCFAGAPKRAGGGGASWDRESA